MLYHSLRVSGLILSNTTEINVLFAIDVNSVFCKIKWRALVVKIKNNHDDHL